MKNKSEQAGWIYRKAVGQTVVAVIRGVMNIRTDELTADIGTVEIKLSNGYVIRFRCDDEEGPCGIVPYVVYGGGPHD